MLRGILHGQETVQIPATYDAADGSGHHAPALKGETVVSDKDVHRRRKVILPKRLILEFVLYNTLGQCCAQHLLIHR